MHGPVVGLDRIGIGQRHAGYPRVPDRTEGADEPVDVVGMPWSNLHPVAQDSEQLGGGLDRADARLGDPDVDRRRRRSRSGAPTAPAQRPRKAQPAALYQASDPAG